MLYLTMHCTGQKSEIFEYVMYIPLSVDNALLIGELNMHLQTNSNLYGENMIILYLLKVIHHKPIT